MYSQLMLILLLFCIHTLEGLGVEPEHIIYQTCHSEVSRTLDYSRQNISDRTECYNVTLKDRLFRGIPINTLCHSSESGNRMHFTGRPVAKHSLIHFVDIL
jgi:hypothetical protein